MKQTTKILFFFLIIVSPSFSQGTAGTNAKYEYRSLIDMPTAGILEKGHVGVGMDVLPYGVIISKIEVGVFDNFSFGISYGGSNIIGSGKVDWYKSPGINARLRVLDETEGTPAITLGFDSQGKGSYFESLNRYEIKSPGIFAAFAKNFDFLGYLSLHGALTYSLERNDGDKDINVIVGFEKTIGGTVSLIAEYDFANNDNTGNSLGDGSGYLNMGVRWSVGDGFTIGLDLRNLVDNKKLKDEINDLYRSGDRSIFVEYIRSIF